MIIPKIDDLLPFTVLLSVIVRWAVSRFPYSGAGKPPMYGDYEAQRHWMEITLNLPIQQWYKNSTENDLLYWGLDYPPLTAYHSMICGYVAKWINADWVALNVSRGYESYHHKIFMRSTVLVADLLFYIPVILYWCIIPRPQNLRNKAIGVGLCLLYPGLILIDHGHFQYNSVCLGLTALAVICLMKGHDCVGAVFFTLALHYKQMSLYYALPFFCYLLGTCLKLNWMNRFMKFIQLAFVVLFVSFICWWPFLTSFESALAVINRLFPFARGLYEDKVANVWCVLSVIIKWKKFFSISQLAMLSAISTLCVVLPSCFHLLRNPTIHNLKISLVNCSLSFFLFSFQVHEKSILFPALPILFLFFDYPLSCTWFAYISTFSLVPLLAKDGLILPFVALSALFLIGAVRALSDLIFQKSLVKVLWFCSSIIGSVILVICMFTVKQPPRYPHLHVLLNCIYSCFHFVCFLVYFNYLQFYHVPSNLIHQKRKIK